MTNQRIPLNSMFLRLLATCIGLSLYQNGIGVSSSVQPKWNDWSRWSECSRTCGIGVSTRSRQCISSQDRNNKTKLNCTGITSKEHRTCNTQRCPPGSLEYRAVQCQQHNNQSSSINRREYSWEPFYKGLNKCALLCRPKGSRFYLQLSSQVADGTRCDPNDPYHICVAGRCEVIGCDGVLGSKSKFDKCGVCGGNDSTCHIISGIFTQTVLPPGYNRVTSIPKGACNINITELAPSLNRLAVKVSNGSYVINGNWKIGPSKDSEAAGTIFTYFHPSATEILESVVEYVTAPGPINSSIDIMVIHEHTNRGIMYTYTIPSHRTHPSLAHKHHLRHHGSRHQLPPITAPTGPPAADSGVDGGREVQSDQVPAGGGGYNQNYQQQQLVIQPRIYRSPSGGGYPSYRNQAPGGYSSNSSGIGHVPPHPDSGVRPPPSIYRGPQVPLPGASAGNYSVNRQTDGTRYSAGGVPSPQLNDRQGYNGGRPLPGVHYRGPVVPGSRPVQPGINYGVQGPLGPPAGFGQPRYGVPGQAGLGYGQPRPPSGIYRQPWYPGQQVGYQPPVNPYQQPPSYPAYQPRPYQIHPPAAQQPYYPHGNAALEQPSLDASSYSSYDYYPHARVPSPLNDQRVVQSSGGGGGGGQQVFSGAADFAWKISGFSECSKTCGGGVQNTLVVCLKVTGVQVIVTEENCDPALKPKVQTVTCSNSPCPPGWEASNWTACSTTCDRGQQTRVVECKRRTSSTHSVGISATHCLHEPRPETVRTCNDERPCVRWRIGEWNQCSTDCGRGQRSREVVCVNYEDKPIAENKCNGTKPKTTEICDMGSCAKTWFYTDWSEQCSIGCGDGVQTRQVHCSAEPDRCSEINRPKSEKPCKNSVPCGGKWFTGPWSECTVTCGEGVARRDVICMKKFGNILTIVSDENCEEDEKPETEEPCEREPCRPEWYTTDWSECSRSCDTGLRLREAKCLDASQQPSQSCDQDEKPETRQTCNTHKCLIRNGHNDTQPLVVSCEDKFKNCRVVVQARLCRYPYYKDVCCFSCISHDHDHEDDHT